MGRAGSMTRAAFVVEADSRHEADVLLVQRMKAHGYSDVDLLYWCIVSVVETGRRL